MSAESDLKMSRNEFSKDEDICDFVKNNLHSTKEIVSFYAGKWGDYVESFTTPEENYSAMIKSFFDAYERKEPFLNEILKPANIRKILGNIDSDFALTNSGFIKEKKDSNGFSLNKTENFLLYDLGDFDFSKIRGDALGKKFYSFLVELVSSQVVYQKFTTIDEDLKIDKRFVVDVLEMADKKAKYLKEKEGLINPLVFVDLLVGKITEKDYFDNKILRMFSKSFLSQEAYTDNKSGNYSQLLTLKYINNISFNIFHEDDFSENCKKVIGCLNFMENKGLYSAVNLKNKAGQEYQGLFRDWVNQELILYANTEDCIYWEKIEPIFEHLNSMFSYSKSYPPSIKAFLDIMNDGLGEVPLSVDVVEKFICFFDLNSVEKVIQKEEVVHRYIAKKFVDRSLINFDNDKDKDPSTELSDKEPSTELSNNFKL